MYDDYCELCQRLKVKAISMNSDFRAHEKQLLEENNFPGLNEALEALRVSVS
jgi:hypothetical protein